MANNFKQVEQGALSLLDNVLVKVRELDQELATINTKLSQMSKMGGGNPEQLKKIMSDYENEIKKLNTALGKQQDQINKLTEIKRRNTKATSEEVINQRALRKEADLHATSNSKVVGAYQRLNAQMNIARKRLRDLIASEKASNAEIKKAQREFDKYRNKVNEANKATSNFSKTSLGGMVKGFKNLLGAFGLVGGVYMFAEFAKATINTIKELDQLNYTLQQVIRNEGELARTRGFLIEMSMKYGAELLSTTNRYVKFNVAARNAGLELKTTERIFETVTEASALLGLKTDELTGIYLALEQMLSKGKVTTEELRRQLGERLPGAFDLMAKALGVTTIELDKMLKKGEVLSKEALPLLTEEIREFYNLSSEGVNTLQTATQKLSSSWDLLIEAMNGSTGVGNLWQGILENLAIGITKVKNAIIGVEGVAEQTAFAEYFKELQDEADKSIPYLEKISKLREEQGIIEDKYWTAQEQLKELKKWDLFAKNEETIAMEKTIGTLEGKSRAIDAYIELLKNQRKEEEKLKSELINKIELYKVDNKITNDKYDLAILEKMSLEDLRKTYQELQNIKEKNLDTDNKIQKAIEGTVDWYEQEIRALKEKRDATAKSTDEYKSYGAEIEKLEKQLEKLIGAQEKLNKITADPSSKKAIQDKINALREEIDSIGILNPKYKDLNRELRVYEELLESVYGEDKTDKIKDQADAVDYLSNRFNNFLRSFSTEAMSDFGFDTLNELFSFVDGADGKQISIFDKMIEEIDMLPDSVADATDKARAKFGVYFNAITEVAQEAFNFLSQNQDMYFERQFAMLEQERDIAIQFAGDSATAREEIERQYEERRRRIQLKQAKAQQDMALFNVILNTAQGVTAALTSIPPNVPLSIAIGVIGAAQAALIKSQPLPEFFRGTQNAPEGWALVDEKQPEIHTDRLGNIKSFGKNKANYRWLSSGDKIYTSHEEYFNKELKGIMDVNGIDMPSDLIPKFEVNVNNGQTLSRQEFMKGINKLMSKETSIVNIDKKGYHTSIVKDNLKTNKHNNILTLKGGIV